MSDGIRKLYDPHIAKQIPTGANSVADVSDKILPAAVMTEEEIDNLHVNLYIPGYLTGFMLDVDRMNEMYRMPLVDTDGIVQRLKDFHSILSEECSEISLIDQSMDYGKYTTTPEGYLQLKTNLADLLGDIIVYCASEAKRWGIPIDKVINIIMQSNFSKLDENGQPIYDERMKLMKGSSYWKPEPKIAELLAGSGVASGGTGDKA